MHTPGPWIRSPVSPDMIRAGIYDNKAKGTCPALCHVLPWRNGEYPLLDDEHAEANARLIAAAPALLAACQVDLAYCEFDARRLSVDEMQKVMIANGWDQSELLGMFRARLRRNAVALATG